MRMARLVGGIAWGRPIAPAAHVPDHHHQYHDYHEDEDDVDGDDHTDNPLLLLLMSLIIIIIVTMIKGLIFMRMMLCPQFTFFQCNNLLSH